MSGRLAWTCKKLSKEFFLQPHIPFEKIPRMVGWKIRGSVYGHQFNVYRKMVWALNAVEEAHPVPIKAKSVFLKCDLVFESEDETWDVLFNSLHQTHDALDVAYPGNCMTNRSEQRFCLFGMSHSWDKPLKEINKIMLLNPWRHIWDRNVVGTYMEEKKDVDSFGLHVHSQSRAPSKKLRFKVLRRDGFRCVSCGKSSIDIGVRLQVDHIRPYSRGGRTTINNLQTLCQDCNLGKMTDTVCVKTAIAAGS